MRVCSHSYWLVIFCTTNSSSRVREWRGRGDKLSRILGKKHNIWWTPCRRTTERIRSYLHLRWLPGRRNDGLGRLLRCLLPKTNFPSFCISRSSCEEQHSTQTHPSRQGRLRWVVHWLKSWVNRLRWGWDTDWVDRLRQAETHTGLTDSGEAETHTELTNSGEAEKYYELSISGEADTDIEFTNNSGRLRHTLSWLTKWADRLKVRYTMR